MHMHSDAFLPVPFYSAGRASPPATTPERAQSHYGSNGHPEKSRVAIYCSLPSLHCAEQVFELIEYA